MSMRGFVWVGFVACGLAFWWAVIGLWLHFVNLMEACL